MESFYIKANKSCSKVWMFVSFLQDSYKERRSVDFWKSLWTNKINDKNEVLCWSRESKIIDEDCGDSNTTLLYGIATCGV